MKPAIGVMGSAGARIDEATFAKLMRVGRAIADRGCTLITGACPGLSNAAVQGAKVAEGPGVGISPALSRDDEHVRKYASPTDGFDVLVFTG